jgi:outer membrane protein assembly factor BamB
LLKITMFLKRRSLLLFGALVVMLMATGCIGGSLEARWGELSLAGEPQNIVFAFSDRIVLINPADGSPVQLRDSNGNVRVDDQGNPRLWQIGGLGGAPAQFYTSPVFLDESNMLVSAYDGRLFTVDFPTARILNPEGNAVGGHIVADSVATPEYLYVPLSERNIQVLARDFSEAWTFETEQGVWAEPLLVDDTLYVSSLDHSLYAIDPTTGAERWKLNLGGAVASTPLYSDGYLYVGSFARKLFKISTDGEIIAEFDTQDWVWGMPVLVDGVLYAGDLGGYVYALEDNGSSFDPLWQPRQVAERSIRATPIVTGNAIIVGARDHNAYWINRATGEEIFRRQMIGEILSDLLLLEPSESLNISEPMVVVSTMAHEELLVAFSVAEGQRLWRYGR